MSTVNYAQLWLLALPQVIVVVAALIALAVDLLLLRARPTHDALHRRRASRVARLRPRHRAHCSLALAGEYSRRNAAGQPAHPSCPDCVARARDRHVVDGDEFPLHPPRWRICSAHPGRHRRQHVPGQLPGPAGHFHFTRTAEPVPLYPDRVRQASPAFL